MGQEDREERQRKKESWEAGKEGFEAALRAPWEQQQERRQRHRQPQQQPPGRPFEPGEALTDLCMCTCWAVALCSAGAHWSTGRREEGLLQALGAPGPTEP